MESIRMLFVSCMKIFQPAIQALAYKHVFIQKSILSQGLLSHPLQDTAEGQATSSTPADRRSLPEVEALQIQITSRLWFGEGDQDH